ncbi:MAG: hypothetical protein QW728_00200, partial [Thermoplasmata archaeon]
PVNNFTAPISLSLITPASLAGLVHGVFNPSVMSGVYLSALTLNISRYTPPGTYNLTVEFTGGNITHYAYFTLVINPLPGFTVTVSPVSSTIISGNSAVYNITITPQPGFKGYVYLTVTSRNSTTSLLLSNSSVYIGSSRPVNITMYASTTGGSDAEYEDVITIRANSTWDTSTNATEYASQAYLHVKKSPWFLFTASEYTLVLYRYRVREVSLYVESRNNFTGNVSFSASVPSGITYSITPSTVYLTVGSSAYPIFNLTAGNNITAGNYNISVLATGIYTGEGSGGAGLVISSTIRFNITIQDPDFDIHVIPIQQAVEAGRVAYYTISLVPTGGFEGEVNLTLVSTGGVNAEYSFSPPLLYIGEGVPMPSGSLLTIYTSSFAAGRYTFNVIAKGRDVASGANITHSFTIVLEVYDAAALGVSVQPDYIVISAGNSTDGVINIVSLNNLSGETIITGIFPEHEYDGILFSYISGPYLLSPGSTVSVPVLIQTTTSVVQGVYNYTVRVSCNNTTAEANLTVVIVLSPDFYGVIEPAVLVLERNETGAGRTSSTTLHIVPANGFSAQVSIGISNPFSFIEVFAEVPYAIPEALVRISACALQGAPEGVYNITLVLSSPGYTTKYLSLQINIISSPDIRIIVPREYIVLPVGITANIPVQIEGLNGFVADLTLSAMLPAFEPPYPAVFVPSSVYINASGSENPNRTATAILQLGAFEEDVAGLYYLVLAAFSPDSSFIKTKTLMLQITPQPAFVLEPYGPLSVEIYPNDTEELNFVLKTNEAFNGTVFFRTSALPMGLECELPPPYELEQSMQLYLSAVLNTSSRASPGTYLIRITAYSKVEIYSGVFIIREAFLDYEITILSSDQLDFLLEPSSTTVYTGESTETRMVISSQTYSGLLEISFSNVPAGIIISTEYDTIDIGAGEVVELSLLIKAEDNAMPGNYSVLVTLRTTSGTGTGDVVVVERVLNITVLEGGFRIRGPDVVEVTGTSEEVIFTIYVISYSNNTRDISLFLLPTPFPFEAIFTPQVVSSSGTMEVPSTVTIRIPRSIPNGIYNLTIAGTLSRASGKGEFTFSLNIQREFPTERNFTVAPPTPVTVERGSVVALDFFIINTGQTFLNLTADVRFFVLINNVYVTTNLHYTVETNTTDLYNLPPNGTLWYTIYVDTAGVEDTDTIRVILYVYSEDLERNATGYIYFMNGETGPSREDYLCCIVCGIPLIIIIIAAIIGGIIYWRSKKKEEHKEIQNIRPPQPAIIPLHPAGVPQAAPLPPPQYFVRCPDCSTEITVTSDKRPLDIVCPKCGKKGRIISPPPTLQSPGPAASGIPSSSAPASLATPGVPASQTASAETQPASLEIPKPADTISTAGKPASSETPAEASARLQSRSAETETAGEASGETTVLKAPMPPASGAAPVPKSSVKCPSCSNSIPIYTSLRPVLLICASCGKKMKYGKGDNLHENVPSEEELAKDSPPEVSRPEKTAAPPGRSLAEVLQSRSAASAIPPTDGVQEEGVKIPVAAADGDANARVAAGLGKVKCTACGYPVEILTSKRPVLLICSSCGKKMKYGKGQGLYNNVPDEQEPSEKVETGIRATEGQASQASESITGVLSARSASTTIAGTPTSDDEGTIPLRRPEQAEMQVAASSSPVPPSNTTSTSAGAGVNCKGCGTFIPILTSKRPVLLVCRTCGKKMKLGKGEGLYENRPD